MEHSNSYTKSPSMYSNKSFIGTGVYPLLMVLCVIFILQTLYVTFKVSSFIYLFSGISGVLSMIFMSIALQESAPAGFFLGYAFSLKGVAFGDLLLRWVHALERLMTFDSTELRDMHSSRIIYSTHLELPFNQKNPSDVVMSVLREINQYSLFSQYLAGALLLIFCCVLAKSCCKSSSLAYSKQFKLANPGVTLCCALLFFSCYVGLMISSAYIYLIVTVTYEITLDIISSLSLTIYPIIWDNFHLLILTCILSSILAALMVLTCSKTTNVSNHCITTTFLTLTFSFNTVDVTKRRLKLNHLNTSPMLLCYLGVKFAWFSNLFPVEKTSSDLPLLVTTIWMLCLVILNPYSHMLVRRKEKPEPMLRNVSKEKLCVSQRHTGTPDVPACSSQVSNGIHPMPMACNLPTLTPMLVPQALRYPSQPYETRNMYLV